MMRILGWKDLFYFLDRAEMPVCVKANSLANYRKLHKTFLFFSKLGDGPAWVIFIGALGVVLPNTNYLPYLLIGACTINLALYKTLKSQTLRDRPCRTWITISSKAYPLDRYSFPSGHTLHAVTITLLTFSEIPVLGTALIPITLMIMLSRVVLGLHYPSDVLVAATIGYIVATLASVFAPI